MVEKISFIHIPKNAGLSIKTLCDSYPTLFTYFKHDVDVTDDSVKNQLVILKELI